MSSCNICTVKVNRDAAKTNCSGCSEVFHAECVNLKLSDIEFLKKNKQQWNCSSCMQKKRNNPTRLSLSDDKVTLEDVFKEIVFIKKSLEKSIESINALNNRLNTLEESVRAVKNLQIQNEALSAQVDYLQNRLSETEQAMHENYLELNNVPEVNGETVSETAMRVIKLGLAIDLSANDLDYCYRKKNTKNGNKSTGTIVIKFLRRSVRENIISAKFASKRNLAASSIDPEAKGSIYVNEWLSRDKKELLAAAKVARKKHQYRFLWVRNGRIMMRKASGDQIKYINQSKDLEIL